MKKKLVGFGFVWLAILAVSLRLAGLAEDTKNNTNILSSDTPGTRNKHANRIQKAHAELTRIRETFDPDKTSLVPLQTLYRYIRQHNDAQLEWDVASCEQQLDCSSLRNRKFMLAYYSCPAEAGNRLHWFFNSILWGIITDRTILWRYLSVEVCDSLRRHNATWFHVLQSSCDHKPNHKKDCDESLSLESWLPSFDQWNQRLQLQQDNNDDGLFVDPPDVNFSWTKEQQDHIRLIQIGNRYRPRDAKFFASTVKDDPRRHQVMSNMEEQGHFFLYGMLFESVFRFPPHMLPDSSSYMKPHRNMVPKTVAVHVRHVRAADQGEDIHVEQSCLQQLFKGHEGPCGVYLLSDRPLTVQLLANVSQHVFHCTPITVLHAQNKSNSSKSQSYGLSFQKDLEHGPNAGSGFFRDLALAANARHGFVSSRMDTKRGRFIALRSSSALVLELIEYRTILDGMMPVDKCFK